MVPFEGNLVIPEVTNDLCIGCGHCEYACPTTPYKAIFVDGNPVHLAAKKPVPARNGATVVRVKNRPLRDLTEEALQCYFTELNGHRPGDLYELVLGEIETPLFKTVLDYTGGNQSVAAEILGINRATLRKKLRQYELLD